MINAIDIGCVPDGVTLNTELLQKTIDACGDSAGGALLFPPGRYLTGGLVLRSNISLHLENGAVLLGSNDLSHYRCWNPVPEAFSESAEGLRALLFALDERNIQISGEGTIDGQGPLFYNYKDVRAGRPRNIWFARCQDVTIDGIRLRNSGFWMQHYLKCCKLRLVNLDIWNHGSCNNDGIDIDCCHDVLVHNCRIDSSDDAICLKSGNNKPTENVIVTACMTRTHCNHFKTGTESNGGFRNILVSGLLMLPSERKESDPSTGGADWRGACGIALGCVDGGALENITVENVTMDQVQVPFFIRLGDRGRPIAGTDEHQSVAYANRIAIRNVHSHGASSQGCFIAGLPDARISNVTIADCEFEFVGGGQSSLLTKEIPQNRAGYPAMEMFGALPAYGIFSRDVDGLELRNLCFRVNSPDPRPSVIWHQCANVKENNITSN